MAKKRHNEHKVHHTPHKSEQHHPVHHKVHKHKKTVHHPAHPHHAPVTINMPAPIQQAQETSKVMIENFVSLQRVMTNLALKLDELSTNISKLLELFEISAKALAEKDFDIEKDNKEILERLNGLVDQNKVLARGMALMHERIPREQQFVPPPPMMQQQMPQMQQPPQQMPSQYMQSMPPIARESGNEFYTSPPPIQRATQEIDDSSSAQSPLQKPPFESPL